MWKRGSGERSRAPTARFSRTVRAGLIRRSPDRSHPLRDDAKRDRRENRYYSNAYGRFMTPDPSASSQDPRTPQSWNGYSYVIGDPVNGTDPSGLDTEETCDGGDGSE